MSHPGTSLRFDGERFVSKAAFDAFREACQDILDSRYAYEQEPGQSSLSPHRGTCAPCLMPTQFQTEGDPAGWRDGQLCGCPDGLGHRARAMLHLLESGYGLDAWSRTMLLGPRSPIDTRLAAGRPAPVRHARLSARPGGLSMDARDGEFTHVMAWDYLQRVPPLDLLLGEIHRVLAPGGVFAFTLPFHYLAATTVSRLGHVPRRAGMLPAEFGGDIHDIGWDVLERLRRAGFARARAHHYWSRELGYLGPFNFLFAAEA
jgi:hypothetical protein